MGRGFGEGLSPGLIGASWPRDHKGPRVEAQLLMSAVWIRPFGYESWQRLWVLPPPPPPPPHALPPALGSAGITLHSSLCSAQRAAKAGTQAPPLLHVPACCPCVRAPAFEFGSNTSEQEDLGLVP